MPQTHGYQNGATTMNADQKAAMKPSKKMGAKLLNDTRIPETKRDNDTIRLWEGYRDQALLWRALTLLQIPVTILSLLLAFTLWGSRTTKIIAPHEAKPGLFTLQEVPDNEFIDLATEYINLVASYQPSLARKQFTAARELLTEPMLSTFDQDILNSELRAIESTSRTQIFFVDPARTKVTRNDTEVNVEFSGDRLKIVAGKELPTSPTKYTVSMKVVPRNKLNPFGLTITSVSFENLEAQR